jgi:hypothetical protein
MTRRALLLVSLLLASIIATAGTRTVEDGTRPAAGATVSGIVTSVSGNLVQLAAGKITIDATGAKVMIDKSEDGTVAQIKPGMMVFAVLTTADVAANAPLPAATIVATRLTEASLFGPVQSVDIAGNTITVLGRTIKVTSDTSFGGIVKRRDGALPGLSDIVPNQIVQVQLEVAGGQLVATSILLLTPTVPDVATTRGTVKSIGTDSWIIERERGDDITVLIDAQTKIVGSPKVGDTVEVLYRVDSARNLVAISILKFEKPPAPPVLDVYRFTGKVKSIATAEWVITRESGDERVAIDSLTKIEPGIVVGDGVDVLARRKDDGSLVALAIVRRR